MHRDIKSVDSFLFVDCVTGHLPPRFSALPPPPLDNSEEDSPEDSSSSEEEKDSSSEDESEEEEPLVRDEEGNVLSEYEAQRRANVMRNQERLRGLGFYTDEMRRHHDRLLGVGGTEEKKKTLRKTPAKKGERKSGHLNLLAINFLCVRLVLNIIVVVTHHNSFHGRAETGLRPQEASPPRQPERRRRRAEEAAAQSQCPAGRGGEEVLRGGSAR